MKNLFIIMSLLFAFTANAEVCLEGRSTSEDNLGNVLSQEECYVNVKNVDHATISKGALVSLDAARDLSYAVEATTTAGRSPACVAQEDIAAGKWGKCQTYGYVDFLLFDVENGSAAAGDEIFISENTAGYSEAEASPAASDHSAGVFLEAVAATSSSVKAFLRLR
jgi:hypothetical protein